MNKTKLMKHIGFFMALCMIFSTFSAFFLTSCGGGGGDYTEAQFRKPAVFNIHFLVGDSTTQEAISEVEKELNYITESKYTTRIKLIGLKSGEYEDYIQECFDKADAKKEAIAQSESISRSEANASKEKARADIKAGLTQAATKKPTEPPTTTDADIYDTKGRINWPEVSDDEINIFLITSTDMFYKYASTDRLAGLDDDLNAKSKVLREYIYQPILMAGQYGEKTLAIPTNKAIGKTTYIAVNKRLAEKYNLDLSAIKDYGDLTNYLETVKANEPDVARIEGPFVKSKYYEQFLPEYPDFAFESYVLDVGTPNRQLVYTPEFYYPTEEWQDGPNALTPRPVPAKTNLTLTDVNIVNKYRDVAFLKLVQLNQEYRNKGLFETSPIPEGKERAAFILEGTLEDVRNNQAIEKDENGEPIYEYIIYINPIATKYDLQDGMYAISSALPTEMVSRCMEIIKLMNTDKQFKNTFQYGKEGVHYIYNDNGRIERISNDYIMNMNYTGNNFIADLMEGENANKWELAELHNLNVVNSGLLKTYLNRSLLSEAASKAIVPVSEYSKKLNEILLNGDFPTVSGNVEDDVDEYRRKTIIPGFEAIEGYEELLKEILAQMPAGSGGE